MDSRYEDMTVCDEAFIDRNLLQLAFVRMAVELGYDGGLGYSPDYDAPVVYVDLDPGLVGFHLRPELYCDDPGWLPERDDDLPTFNGQARIQRLERFIADGPNIPDENPRDL